MQDYISNPAMDLITWVTQQPNGCITLDKNAPFLRYPNHNPNHKPQIKAKTLDGHDYPQNTSVYGIQKYALTVLGNEAYDNEHQYETSCGNPLCMNPEHIIRKGSSNKSSKKKSVNTGSLVKLNKYQEVMRLSVQGVKSTDIAERVGMSASAVCCWRNQMMSDLLGDDYRWNDFLRIRDIADGMRYAEDKRNDPKSSIQRLFDDA